MITKTKIIMGINRFQSRKGSGSYENLNNTQKKLYNVTQELSVRSSGLSIKRRDIKQMFKETYPGEKGFEESRNMLADFCYNKVNFDDKPFKFLYWIGRGEYKFVDFSWNTGSQQINVEWTMHELGNTFKIGAYSGTEFHWDFIQLLRIIEDL